MIEVDSAFWARRGLPIEWAGARKKNPDLGLGAKMIATAAVVGVLVIALLFVWGHVHG
jgi:hypothetical protein